MMTINLFKKLFTLSRQYSYRIAQKKGIEPTEINLKAIHDRLLEAGFPETILNEQKNLTSITGTKIKQDENSKAEKPSLLHWLLRFRLWR